MANHHLGPNAAACRAHITLTERIQALVSKHGSLRAAARAIQIDHGYMARLAAGEKLNPSGTTLKRLGLRKVVYYEPMPFKVKA